MLLKRSTFVKLYVALTNYYNLKTVKNKNYKHKHCAQVSHEKEWQGIRAQSIRGLQNYEPSTSQSVEEFLPGGAYIKSFIL